MKTFLKVTMSTVAVAATMSMAVGQYTFPQNMKHPHGTTIEYADTDMIKQHYQLWKKAWYDASQGWILAPEGTCSTVSEAIAYGMLITVYMDDEDVFKKLYNTWKSNGGNGAGMNWRIGCDGGTGSASDADFDAALALVMASKQWNNSSYLSDAKSIISWMATNDINGNKIKPGNQWNDAFNPSYAATANFQLFQDVNGGSWSSVISQAYTDLNACQDGTTGLVPDWCDWSGHKPTKTSAAVSNDIGFYDDASRTPWRTAMAYYWYGDTKAQAFNKKIVDWLIPETHTASGVNSGYKYTNGKYEADLSTKRNFVSSSFSGGLGLATSSFADNKNAVTYLGTVYNVLKELKSCETAQGCGDNVKGEKYFPATLNMIYLLLMTGNMPNLYNLTGFEKFTPDPSKAPSISSAEGEQMALKDSTVGVSGFWNWGAYHDKLGIGTTMSPDSGTSPLYKRNCEITADASMKIGPEPEWTKEAADAGLLKYPSAGIAMSFLSNDKKGVDLTQFDVKAVRVTMKASGPIRMATLSELTGEAGAEPGTYVPNSEDYKTTTYDLTPMNCGFKGFDDPSAKYPGGLLDWVDQNKAPFGEDILKTFKGLKWEVKDAKGGIGELSIKAVEFLDASGNVIDPSKITGIVVPEATCSSNPGSSSSNPGSSSGVGFCKAPSIDNMKVIASGNQVQVLGASVGSAYTVFSLQGKVVASGMITSASQGITVPNKGTFLVRVGTKLHMVAVK
ncbi:MAG: glycoside hydrolase [Fibrobacter sp.]|nr:glycoside hydrolase [Fibrobacter sp.]MBR6854565.1 glycoside hydrolase [Fibrobacter sp.]